MAQTTQNLPETDPTIQIPYLEEVEVTKEKFDSEQRRKNVELNGYLEQSRKIKSQFTASSAGLRILMMLREDLQDSPFFTNKKTYLQIAN